jgi:hypothetical protein
MSVTRLISTVALTIGLVASGTNAFAHGTGPGDFPDGLMVTRHFTGIWDQVDQEAQGLAIQVVEQLDDSRASVVYWYTYGADRNTAWFLGIGELIDNRIEYNLFESTDVGFMQDAKSGNDSVMSIGTMTIVFDSCDSGVVTYATDHATVGNGTFNIERVLEVMNTHCSGGISDDMHVDGMFGEQRLALTPAREGVTGNGLAQYDDFPGHMEFEVKVEGLPDGDYHLYVGVQDRGSFTVQNGHGGMEFASPAEDGKMMMPFDPRGQQIEIHDIQGVTLSSFDDMFEEGDRGHHGDGHDGDDDHNYDCEFGPGSGHGGMGGGMGGGMHDCVDDGDFVEIEVDLDNTGVLPAAKGEAEWEMNSQHVEFSVEIQDVPVGSYPLKVAGVQVGIIEAFEMHMGDVYGHIRFRDPESYGREHLDFEPRGNKIEVFQGENIILKVDFPME